MKLKRTSKLLALLLAVVMVCSLLPATALADGGGQQEPSPNPTKAAPEYVITSNVEWASESTDTTKPYLQVSNTTDNIIDSSKDQTLMIRNYASISETLPLEYVEIDGLQIPISAFGTSLATYDTSSCPNLNGRTVNIGIMNGILAIRFVHDTGEPITENIAVSFVFAENTQTPNMTPTVEIAEGQTTMGAISSLAFIENTTEGSTWKLITTPSSSAYLLSYIQIGEDDTTRVESSDGTTITWEVTVDGAAYTAYFSRVPDEILDVTLSAAPEVLGINEGQWANVAVRYKVTENVLSGTAQVFKVYAGEEATGTPISVYTYSGPDDTLVGEHSMNIPIAAMPAGVTKVTVTLCIDGGDTLSKTSDAFAVKASGETELSYLAVPGDAPDSYVYESYSITGGPIVFDTAYVDGTIYLASSDGVILMDVSGAMTQMPGTDGTPFVAIGGSGSALYALAMAGGRDEVGGKVYALANGSWTAVDGSDYSSINITQNSFGLVMSGSDIWTGNYHWDGESWTANSVAFNSFWKADATTAYAGSANGVYLYTNGAWSAEPISGTSAGAILSGVRTSAGAKLLTAAGSNFNTRMKLQSSIASLKLVSVSDNSATETAISLDGFAAAGAFLDLDGNVYVANKSHGSNLGFMYQPMWTSTELFKYENGSWVFQKADALFSNEDLQKYASGTYDRKSRADFITWASSPAEGINFILGAYGTAYSMFGDATISFESNGGSDVSPITATIGSAVTPPASPERDGWNFAGWYLSNKDIAMGNAPYAWSTMPAGGLTLYAKWSEKSSGGTTTDPFAVEKANAKNSLATTAARLTQSDYDASVWSQITAAKSAGESAIDAATTYDGVYAALNAAVDQINALAQNVSGTMTVAVTVEKFTYDGQWIIEPTLVTADKNELASVVVTDLLKTYWAGSYSGTPYTMTGTEVSNFYLSGAWDGTTMLSEFDNGIQSGWVYCVNGSFPGVGASGWILQNGDVMRWQYTSTGLGADVGADNRSFGGSGGVTVADKDALIWRVAEINQAGEQEKYGDAYDEAMTVLKTITAPQSDVDAALAALNGGGTGGGSGSGTTDKDKDENPTVFEDVPEDAYYAEAVAWAVEKGITDGVTETEFKPESTCNRGQIVTFLWRAAGSPKPTSTNNPFEDVKETDYFYEAVLWAVENGITDGVDATHFAPARPCTREQAVTFMWRAAGSAQVSGGTPFADVDAGDYSAAAVAWAVENGITDGVSDTRFAPENECTRGQIVTFLYREYGEQ